MRRREKKPSIGIVSLGACAITEPDSGFPVGGSELQLHLLALALAKNTEISVTLHVADVGQKERRENGVTIHPLAKVSPDLHLGTATAFAITARLARARHDLYITRSASGLNGLATVAARWARAKHLHMCAHDDECRGKAEATLSKMARRFHRLGMKHAHALACQTEAQRVALREYLSREAILCPNLPPNCEAKDLPLDDRRGVLWVGRDVEWKQPEMFIDLARELPDIPFTMICQPQPDSDIMRLTADTPGNLTFHPGLPFHETAALYGTHRLLASTSTAEGFPNTFLQAAAVGTPIISLTVDPDCLIESCNGGMACGGDFARLAAEARELLSDNAAWDACHKNIAKAAAARSACAENNILRIINEILQRDKGMES
jgi:glycosyltransferase involved in cell wall biosynthesis